MARRQADIDAGGKKAISFGKDYYVICDRSGILSLASECAMEYTGLFVRKELLYKRDPKLDGIRSIRQSFPKIQRGPTPPYTPANNN